LFLKNGNINKGCLLTIDCPVMQMKAFLKGGGQIGKNIGD